MNTWKRLQKQPNLWKRYFIREKVLRAIRLFFEDRKFHEIETPILISHPPAESYLDVFETTLYDRNRKPNKAYLSTSPEVSLKKLLVAGLKNCFALTKSFRNMETQSALHNPEFTILEWYRTNVDYREIMNDCEELLIYIHTYLFRTGEYKNRRSPQTLQYQGKTVNLSSPWDRMTVAQAFERWAHIDFFTFLDDTHARSITRDHGYTVSKQTTWEEMYNQVFLNEIEPHLGRGKPLILYEFPAELGALARKKKTDPRVAERFEFYIEGLELGDCYSELTDWKEQRMRFDNEMKVIRRLGKTSYEYDKDFIDALRYGLPESSGIAIGVDRLIMLFANAKTIQDTLFFPGKELFRV